MCDKSTSRKRGPSGYSWRVLPNPSSCICCHQRLCHTLSARRTWQVSEALPNIFEALSGYSRIPKNSQAKKSSRKLQNLDVTVIEWGTIKALFEKNKANALDHNCACSTACPCIFPASIVEIAPSHDQRMMSTGGQKPVLDLDSTQFQSLAGPFSEHEFCVVPIKNTVDSLQMSFYQRVSNFHP